MKYKTKVMKPDVPTLTDKESKRFFAEVDALIETLNKIADEKEPSEEKK